MEQGWISCWERIINYFLSTSRKSLSLGMVVLYYINEWFYFQYFKSLNLPYVHDDAKRVKDSTCNISYT